MSERLTERVGDGIRYDNGEYVITCYPKNDNLTPVDKLAAKLCDLEDKIENGAVIVLPCKVGDTVYMPWEWNGQKGIACLTVTVSRCIIGFGWSFGTDFDTDDEDYYDAYNCGDFKLKDFGKTVFLTREEAEKALAERRGNES